MPALCLGASSVTRWHYLKGWGKFKQIHDVKNRLLIFVSLKHYPPPPPPPQHVLDLLPSHLCHGFSGKRVYCKNKQNITWCQTQRRLLPSKACIYRIHPWLLENKKKKCSLCSDSTIHTKQGLKVPDLS